MVPVNWAVWERWSITCPAALSPGCWQFRRRGTDGREDVTRTSVGLAKDSGDWRLRFQVRTRKPRYTNDNWGLCDFNAQTTYIFESCSPQLVADTFIHEVLHAIH